MLFLNTNNLLFTPDSFANSLCAQAPKHTHTHTEEDCRLEEGTKSLFRRDFTNTSLSCIFLLLLHFLSFRAFVDLLCVLLTDWWV